MTIATAGGVMLAESGTCPKEGPGSDTVLLNLYATQAGERRVQVWETKQPSSLFEAFTRLFTSPCTRSRSCPIQVGKRSIRTPNILGQERKPCPSKNSRKVGTSIVDLITTHKSSVHVGVIGGSGLYNLGNLTFVSVFFYILHIHLIPQVQSQKGG